MLSKELTERSVVGKVLVSVPKRFKATISCLEYSKDPIKLTLTKPINAFQAHEHRKAIRMEESKAKVHLQLHKKKTNTYVRKK